MDLPTRVFVSYIGDDEAILRFKRPFTETSNQNSMDIEAGLTYKVYMSFFVGPDYKGVTDPSWAESPYLWGQYEEDEDGK